MKKFRRKLLFAFAALAGFAMESLPVAAQERPELTIAVDNLWETMDPVIGISTSGARVHFNSFDTLIRRNRWEDPDGTLLVPWLATKWERTAPTVWEFTLREGVKFHDGHVMDAEDVAFISWCRLTRQPSWLLMHTKTIGMVRCLLRNYRL